MKFVTKENQRDVAVLLTPDIRCFECGREVEAVIELDTMEYSRLCKDCLQEAIYLFPDS